MNSQQRLARAYLTAVRRPEPVMIRRLVERHGLVRAAEMVASAGATYQDWELHAIRQLDYGRRHELRFVSPEDREWPAALKLSGARQLAPLGLWLRGKAEINTLFKRAVVVLGATVASPYGTSAAFGLSCELSAAGWTVLSTGSYGVAGAVHRGSLSVDRPTIAMPRGGLLRPRPLGHGRLFGRIANRGLMVSQYAKPPADGAVDLAGQSWLLSTAAAAVVLVEPEPTRLTNAVIRRAQALGKPLLAFPGTVTSASSEFAHQLVRDGAARLTRNGRDVLADLGAAAGGR